MPCVEDDGPARTAFVFVGDSTILLSAFGSGINPLLPVLPNKPCGAPRADDRRVLNGDGCDRIFGSAEPSETEDHVQRAGNPEDVAKNPPPTWIL